MAMVLHIQSHGHKKTYQRGSFVPNFNEKFVITFSKDPTNTWISRVVSPQGTTIYKAYDRKPQFLPSASQTSWNVEIMRVGTDEPDKRDPHKYFRYVTVKLLKPVSSKHSSTLPASLIGEEILRTPGDSAPDGDLIKGLTFKYFPGVTEMIHDHVEDSCRMEYIMKVSDSGKLLFQPDLSSSTCSVTIPMDVKIVHTVKNRPKYKQFIVQQV